MTAPATPDPDEQAQTTAAVDFRALFDASPTPLLVIAPPDWTIVAVNDARARIIGVPRDQQIGRRLFDVFPDDPDDPEADGVRNLTTSLQRVMATKASDVMAGQRYAVRDPDGRFVERWWRAINTPVLDDKGEVAIIIHRVEEVTEVMHLRGEATARDQIARDQQAVIERLRATEEALRQSEAQLRELNETLEVRVAERTAERDRIWQTSPDLLLVIDFDGVFRRVNPAWTEILGYLEDQLVGTRVDRLVHPEDVELTEKALAEAAGGPLPVIENRYRHKDGSYRWISWITAPPEDGLIYASGRHVTAEKAHDAQLRAAEAAQRQADALYRAYFENTAEALFVVSVLPDGGFCIDDLNPAHQASIGLPLAEVAGKRIDEVLPAELAEQVCAHYRYVLKTGEVHQYREAFQLNGEATHWDTVLVPVRDPEGQIVRLIGASRDLSRQLAAEEQLRQAQKMEAVGQLTGGVAHDFNNLLTIIKASTDLLRRPDLAQDRRRRYVDAISDTVDRAAKLTGQLLAFARRQALKPEVFDARERIRVVTDMVGSVVGYRIRIVTDLPSEPCFVEADVNQFETALVNMALNARDAMEDGGTLTMRVEALPSYPGLRRQGGRPAPFVAVAIADTGTGISPDAIGKIFEPFFTTKEVGKGTGLGLSQVYGFAKQSGGDVGVESEVGRGTTVTLYLPRVEAGTVESVSDTRAAPAIEEGRGHRVLVVEDNADVGAFSTQLLQDLGYETTWAANAGEALALLDGGRTFDVVFSDVIMPGMSGVELGQVVRRRYPGLPVILTSGYSHVLAEEGRHGFELLQKPYAVEELSRVLRRVSRQPR